MRAKERLPNADLDAQVIAFDRAAEVHSEESEVVPPEYSDIQLATEFVELCRDQLRYVAAWARWMDWTGTHWKAEKTNLAFDMARKVCAAAAVRAGNKPNVASRIASATTIAAVERIAKADRDMAAVVEQWDQDAWALNTPDGTIDLNTGERRTNRPDDFITKSVAVSPGGDCPQFLIFLRRITGDDPELQSYLQRIFGYCLTGSTQEHALFFFHGSGANGKSVLMETVSGILSDYATNAPMETFTASRNERHPTDLAKMRGARLVTATETEEGRFWAEARIKALTGGDTVTARFMRGDYFDYVPAFKLVIAGNHKPRIKTVDEAIRRRFNLVPFTVTIPAHERDPSLAEKLKEEWPGILQWMIDGCIAWQEQGRLNAPQSVISATAEYLEGEDAMAAWLAESCDVDPAKADRSSTLYESWSKWVDKSGEYRISQREFSQKLEARGFEKRKTRNGAQFIGLAVNNQPNWADA